MKASAWVAISLRGWPARAIVALPSGLNTTGMSPRSSWPAGILGISTLPDFMRDARSNSGCCALGFKAFVTFLVTFLYLSAGLRILFNAATVLTASVPTGALDPAPVLAAFSLKRSPRRCCSGSLAGFWAGRRRASAILSSFSFAAARASSFAFAAAAAASAGVRPISRDFFIRCISSHLVRSEVASVTTLRVGHGDLGWYARGHSALVISELSFQRRPALSRSKTLSDWSFSKMLSHPPPAPPAPTICPPFSMASAPRPSRGPPFHDQ
mmetsp:Transcript_2646/g.5258  ORF Transcript_2646/g.5258 Transcript_2646/m.5258 type:complete len:269 (+) Transcript_2646:619-1425(+)